MSNAATEDIPKRSWLPIRLIRIAAIFVVGTLLCLSPLTSIIVLGWLMALMRRRALNLSGLSVGSRDRPRWVFGPRGKGWFTRLLGGLGMNIRFGFNAAISLWIATFPFAGFWLVAWWAGWENSFNRGYEQAVIGPSGGIAGIAVFAVIMVYLPMGLAHQAVEGRAFSFFELRRVRDVVAYTRWSYVIWAFSVVFLALPVFASRGLPAFGEGIIPGLADMSVEEVASLRGSIDLIVAAYIFVTSVFLKRWSARIYAVAVRRALGSESAPLWQGSVLDAQNIVTDSKRPRRIGRLLRFLCLINLWVALAVLIFVGQFLNHEWHVWLTHPYVFLPWIM
jgi:hypothetical protein